jgi:phosphoribosylaminoimidazole (AIR) synthetase
MQLSKNFTLEEFTRSATAKRLGIWNEPSNKQIENIQGLVDDFLQPLRDYYKKPIKITSGFRSLALNRAVGGTKGSFHRCLGSKAAADFTVVGVPVSELFELIHESNLPYKQIIREFGRWVHVSYNLPEREALVATKKNGKTIYTPFET